MPNSHIVFCFEVSQSSLETFLSSMLAWEGLLDSAVDDEV